MNTRIALFDNLKGLAIVLVVTGHFLERFTGVDNSHFLQVALTYIYLFHIPLFIFCSGLFAGKSWIKSKGLAPVDKVLLYLFLYLFFCGLVAIFDLVILGNQSTLNPFVINRAPWFMLALAIFFVMVPIMGSVKPLSFMITAIAVSVLGGVFLENSTQMTISRALLYLPYFALGFYLQPDKVVCFIDKAKSLMKICSVQVVAWVLLVLIFFTSVLFTQYHFD